MATDSIKILLVFNLFVFTEWAKRFLVFLVPIRSLFFLLRKK